MPFSPAGGSGDGGGGLTLGPAPNSFTAATRTLAETARDNATTGITGTLLAQYDAEPTFTITLNWPATPTNTVYQARRGGAWADVTGLVRGPTGSSGADGTDGAAGTHGTDGTDGAAGTDGVDGASGGGALQLLGTIGPRTITAAQDDLWIDLGFDWPDDADFIVFRRVAGALLIWLDGAEIYGDDAVVVGTIGAASVTAQRYTINDAGLSGTTYLGRNAAGRALIEFNNTIATAFTLQFYKYVQGNENGLQGPAGLPGVSGVDGADGTDGTDGQPGPAGTDGNDGDDGSTTTSGTADPSGGNAGDSYYQVNASNVIQSLWLNIAGTWTEFTLATGVTPSGSHTRYFGWSADRVIDTPDFTGANTSTSDEGTFPARTMQEGNAYLWFAEPEDEGEATEVYLADDDTTNQINTFTRQAGTIDDDNGDPHIVTVSDGLQTYLYGGADIRIGHN